MKSLTGTWTLIRFILRRDRIRIPIWIIGIVGFFLLLAVSFPEIFPTEQERQARAQLMSNPTAIAFRGPGFGLEDYTYGVIMAHELMGYGMIAVALMSIFLVVRHTRAEEESGRLELVRSSIVGRYAPPVAALTVAIGANVVIAGLFAGLLPMAHSDYSTSGALAFGLATGSVGIVFAAVGAITAQLTEYGRGASSMAALVLGASYLIRAVGDVQENWISWLSPFGWGQQMRPFVDELWWPLALPMGISLLLLASVFLLINRRDVGAGILPQKPGPARASDMLVNPVGFVFRQQRGSIIGWALGVVVIGVAFGTLIGEVEGFIADNPQIADFLDATGAASPIDGFLGLLVMIMAFLATGFAVSSAMRPRAEESEGRAEPVLSTALARPRWLGSYLTVAMAGSATILLAGAASLGIMAAADQGDSGLLTGTLGAALAYIPAIWLVIGIAAALFGARPGLLVLPWIVLIFAVFAGLFADMVNMPNWARVLSPFEHVPDLPGGTFEIWPIAILAFLAALLIGIGQASFRSRDLEMS
jgi:ABC-2 type transport system permease protein